MLLKGHLSQTPRWLDGVNYSGHGHFHDTPLFDEKCVKEYTKKALLSSTVFGFRKIFRRKCTS